MYLYRAREIPRISYWQPGKYLYLQWATHNHQKLLATWQISVPALGKRDTKHKLLATWQISVPALGKRDTKHKLLATWQISVPALGKRDTKHRLLAT